MTYRSPIRRDIYNINRSPEAGGLRSIDTGFDRWRGDASRNPALRAATDDDQWIENSRRRVELAQQLQARENARREKEQGDMLAQALASGNANLFDEPENEQDEELQRIMQEFTNAGTRGVERQYSPQALALARKTSLENAAQNRANRAQSLDESQFIDQKRRNARDFALNTQKAVSNDAYRQNLMAQRQQQMEYEALMDRHKEFSAMGKQALDLVKDGMDPEEVISLFPLNQRDQKLLRSYGAMADDEEQRAVDPMLDFLNERELGMRTPVMPEEEPGFFGRMMGARPTQGPPVPPGHRANYQLPDTGDAEFQEMLALAAKEGFRYDPTQGFYNQPRKRLKPNLPIARTPQEAARFPKGMRFQNLDGEEFVR